MTNNRRATYAAIMAAAEADTPDIGYTAGKALALSEGIPYRVAHMRIMRMMKVIAAGRDPLKDGRGGRMTGAGRKRILRTAECDKRP